MFVNLRITGFDQWLRYCPYSNKKTTAANPKAAAAGDSIFQFRFGADSLFKDVVTPYLVSQHNRKKDKRHNAHNF